jgi:hypothetical protein
MAGQNIDDTALAAQGLADAAFTFTFSEPRNGAQTGTARYATGAPAASPRPPATCLSRTPRSASSHRAAGPGRPRVGLFTGVRSDPFFADAEGSFHHFAWTGTNAFAGRNILSIAMEVPGDMLSADPAIRVWATVSVRRDGTLVQVDRGGHPTINPFINPNRAKDEFNTRQPADDLANYLQPWSKLLEDNGYPPDEARAAALIVLPDILRYNHAQPAAYPNGRALTDDVFSARFAWLTHGRVTCQGLKLHDDLLADFPCLGPPNLHPVG